MVDSNDADIHVRVPGYLKAAAQNIADAEERKLTWVVIKALRNFVEEYSMKKGT